MFIEYQDVNYEIFPKVNLKGIKIRNVTSDITQLEVPLDYSKEMLLSYIKNTLPRDIKKYQLNQQNLLEQINLFDRSFTINKCATEKPYIKGKQIFVSYDFTLHQKNIYLLKIEILQNFINDYLSKIEEDLQCLLPTINIKKLRKNYYTIAKNSTTITYSFYLIEKEQNLVNYIITNSIKSLLSKNEYEYILQKYNKEYIRYKRILDYEQQYLEDKSKTHRQHNI